MRGSIPFRKGSREGKGWEGNSVNGVLPQGHPGFRNGAGKVVRRGRGKGRREEEDEVEEEVRKRGYS